MTASLMSRLTAKSLWLIPKPIARFITDFTGISEPRGIQKESWGELSEEYATSAAQVNKHSHTLPCLQWAVPHLYLQVILD